MADGSESSDRVEFCHDGGVGDGDQGRGGMVIYPA